jgi:hypothetical protein
VHPAQTISLEASRALAREGLRGFIIKEVGS